MASQVQIVNLALSNLGKFTISSMTEASDAARRASAAWDPIRQAVLRDHPWGFALRTVPLAEAAGVSVPGWSYAYIYPPDCLKVVKLFSPALPKVPRPYTKEQVDDNLILACNVPGASLQYIGDVTDTSRFDPSFVDAMVFRLAAVLAKPLTGDKDLMGSMMALYKMQLDNAMTEDAQESHEEPEPDPELANPYWAAR